MRKSICITGGIGSGKSSVAEWLAFNCQLQYFDADQSVANLLKKGAKGWEQLQSVLGPSYYDNDGMLKKAKLRHAIFSNKQTRKKVEQILHPLVFSDLEWRVQKMSQLGGGASCLIEIPLVYEVGWQDKFGKVLVVYADSNVCIDRITRRDHQDVIEAKAAHSAQLCLKEKALAADWVIDNSANWSFTLLQLKQLQRIIFLGLNSEKP